MSKDEKSNTKETKAAFVPKVKRNLTLPVLKMQIDQPCYIRIDEPMKVGKKVDEKKDEAILCAVTNLETGEQLQMLVPAVLQGVFHDEYGAPKYGKADKNAPMSELEPGEHNYVGLGFAVTKHAKASGKQYHPHSIQEIEL